MTHDPACSEGGGLPRYVLAATLARAADGGGVVAVILLVTMDGGPAWMAGMLGACITFPHLLGPFIARSLDVARDGRTVLAIACVVHGGTLAAAALLYPYTSVVVPAGLLIVSGIFGPLLTGGISSRLPAIAGRDQIAQRRAQGWDVATYGIGGTAGPTVVAVVSAWSDATVATLVLAGGTFVAAFLVRLLPYAPPPGVDADVPRPLSTLRIIAGSGPLRRTLYLTVVVAFAVAVLPVTAVAGASAFGVNPAVGGVLTAAYGLGGLAGSAGVMIRPLRGSADLAMPVLACCVAVALVGVMLAWGVWTAAAAFAVTGLLNSYFFASTLAARTEYSPSIVQGQVFVWVGALKISSGSAGTAVAGALTVQSLHLPLVLGASLTVSAAMMAWIDQATTGGRRERN